MEEKTIIRYADDTATIAENIQDLQKLTDHVNTEYGFMININKTKYTVINNLMYAQRINDQ